MGERWLSDDGVINFADIQYGKLNVIDAPCGSGKTTFIEKKLWQESYWGELLYLADSHNNLMAFKMRGERKEYNGQEYYKHRGITAMTYATFAILCDYKEDCFWWDDEDALIVCDELQSVIKWSKIKGPKDTSGALNIHKRALKELHRRIKIGARVVAITATSNKIREEFSKECVDVPIHGMLKRYNAKQCETYTNLVSLLDHLPADKRGVIYTPQVKQLKKIQKRLAERGIKAVGIWSENNEVYSMDEEAVEVRESILKHERIPESVKVLLINAASETGINIKSPIDYVVVNSSDTDTQIQVVGRVRHDIETKYLHATDDSRTVKMPNFTLDKKWTERKLFAEDKNALCEELNLRDRKGRLWKWTNTQKVICNNGYSVSQKREKDGRRYVVITS